MAKICENCGATYFKSDGYCKNCWKKLSDEEGIIKGLPKSDWGNFIGKNADRYTKVFSENENKKVFFKLNWAALLFGFNWMFYRKMYKFAFIHLIITTVFLMLVYGAVYGIYKNDIVLYQKLDAQYDVFRKTEQKESEFTYNEKGEITGISVDYPDFIDEYRAVTKRLKFFPAFLISALPFALNVFLALLADCTYRAYVYSKLRENKSTEGGGCSVVLFFVAVIINAILDSIIIVPMIEKFTSFFDFSIIF